MSRLMMMIMSEKVIQKSTTRARCSVQHTNFLWALCQGFVRSITLRFVAFSGVGLPLFTRLTTSSIPRK